MLRRYIEHQSQPQHLMSLPFRIIGFATAIYVLITSPRWDSEQTHVATLIILATFAAMWVIDLAWWAARQYRDRRA
jgi:membrane protein DedA with SNARE-associated domain